MPFHGFYGLASLKMIHSTVQVSFADHRCLSCSMARSQHTKETAMASFQLEECAQLVIAPTT